MTNLIIDLVYLLLLGIQLITCVFLIIRIFKIKKLNLIPLILFFFFNPLEVILTFIVGTSNIVNMFSNISLIVFTKYTFYRERQSAFIYLLISLIIVKSIDFTLKVFIPFSLPLNFVVNPQEVPLYYLFLAVMSLSVLLSYPWLGISALKYYNSIKTKDVEPWIKIRYKLIGYSSLIITINSFLYILVPIDTYNWEQLNTFIIGLLITINTAIFSVSNLLAWIMPQRLKNYFNRNYQGIIEENLTEMELMDKIRYDKGRK